MIGFIIGLVVFGVLLLLTEILLPGGVSGAMGGICLIAAIILGFTHSVMLGVYLMLGSMLFSGVMLFLFIKYMPGSAVGKQLFLQESAKDWDGFDTNNLNLVGKRGVACTMLRPSGMAMINDERVDVVTEGDVIHKDQAVEVVEVEGNRIVVIAAKEEDAAPA
jgi:membrane-bound serine protease (ClpP class)